MTTRHIQVDVFDSMAPYAALGQIADALGLPTEALTPEQIAQAVKEVTAQPPDPDGRPNENFYHALALSRGARLGRIRDLLFPVFGKQPTYNGAEFDQIVDRLREVLAENDKQGTVAYNNARERVLIEAKGVIRKLRAGQS